MPGALRPVVLSGPSGSGKSSLIKMLIEKYPCKFGFSVSHTTRQPRDGETNGKDYHFVDVATITKLIDDGQLLESAVYGGNTYGTSKKAIQAVLDQGKVCLMDIDSQGVKSVKKAAMDCLLLFVKPPSLEVLEKRLRGRSTETEAAIEKRIALAKNELDYASLPGVYHFTIVNDHLDEAFENLKTIISREIIQL